MTDRNDIDYSRAALTLRTAGRRGDSVLAHLTPGEVVVPVSVLRAVPGLGDLLAESFTRANLDVGRYIVGGADDSRNPKTGLPEYYDEEPGDTWGGGYDWGGDDYDFEDNKTGGYGGRTIDRELGTDFGSLEDDGGNQDINSQSSDVLGKLPDHHELPTNNQVGAEPKRGRTLIGRLNIRRETLSFSERLGSSGRGKVRLGQ